MKKDMEELSPVVKFIAAQLLAGDTLGPKVLAALTDQDLYELSEWLAENNYDVDLVTFN